MRPGAGNTWRPGSGLPWNSGVYTSQNAVAAGPAAVKLFGSWRGTGIDVATAFVGSTAWSDIEAPNWLFNIWQNVPYTMAFAVPMLPASGATLAAGATGTYDSHWTTFGQTIAAYPSLANSIIRLGWEFNGTWYAWSCSNADATNYKNYWQHVVTAVRANAPNLKWNWCVNRGQPAGGLTDPTTAWPGATYVDQVGIDSYDWFLAANNGGWNGQLNGTQGLAYWLGYAQGQGVKMSVPEWACTPVVGGSDPGRGDDSTYITNMTGWFRTNAASLAYEAMFQGSNMPPIGTLPNAAAAYKAAL
jgi:hypothetical protein